MANSTNNNADLNAADEGNMTGQAKTPVYRVLGESGLVEDEEGNILSASEIDGFEESEKRTHDTELSAAFTESSFVSALDDKANPAYWYYYYDPRYCGPSREAYMEEMARRHRHPDNQESQNTPSPIAAEPAEENPSVAAEPARRMLSAVSEAAKKKADMEQREAEREGLHPDYHYYSTATPSCGMVNRNKDVIVSYDEYSYIGYYHNGLARVLKKKTRKFGFVDRHGDEVIPCTWGKAGEFSEYMAGVQGDNKKCGYIDVTGRMAIPCVWENGWPFHEGLAKVQDRGKVGMIDQSGQIVIPCIWKGMGDFSDGLAGVQDSDGKCGYIDITGEVVIPCRWKNVWAFSEGLAIVQDFNKKLGFIDKSGELVIPCRWKKADFFKNGRARVLETSRFFRKDKWVYIDKQGRVVKQ
ncbi:MAG: WG repeat-containing protein [Prevotella sp.]|nr:WG repeat-containing protein [Prevotella sp.]